MCGGGKNVAGIDIIIKKKPGGQNMACMSNGTPCNQDQVGQLAAELSKRGVSISLAASDGALRCTTRNGKECTDEDVGKVQVAARLVNTKADNYKAIGTKGISGS